MLPQIKENQKIYIEITNLKHGGIGWELGACLWSPKFSRNSYTRSWKLMEKVNINDTIIHLVKIKNKYHFYGISTANSELIETNEEPPLSEDWGDREIYQRINITNFTKVEVPYPIDKIFIEYHQNLKDILQNNRDGQFYNLYREELRVAQKYFAACSPELYNVFDLISRSIGFKPELGIENNINVPTKNEPQSPDYNPAGRVKTIISRLIRDTKLSRLTKAENNWKCQICGKSIQLPNGFYYSEGHHLKPLGGEHQGPDIEGNIIILCPYHHTEFDYGSIAINPETKLIEHIDSHNQYHLKQLAYNRENLGSEFLRYHYGLIFNKS